MPTAASPRSKTPRCRSYRLSAGSAAKHRFGAGSSAGPTSLPRPSPIWSINCIATRPRPDLRGSNHDDQRAAQQTAGRDPEASGFALTRGVRHHSFLPTRLGARASENRFRRHAFRRRLGGHGGSGRIRGRAGRASELYAETRKAGTPVDDMDTLIAGIALAHGRIVVTCNTDHFTKLPGLTVEDWSL
ncbi:hypothetical protein BDD21_0049 [Thiocapsa rosea]|uniref:PIN domain-containing protein n=1 Tax=Thiocapsa rosea TaxID=69360 RepID=A0A495V038_9GAMM|nr:hypothetical protein BDD21_0049 [Thiocapsa rosea]